MYRRKILSLFMILTLVVFGGCSKLEQKNGNSSENNGDVSKVETDNTPSAKDIVSKMNAGWNLGNTLENTSQADYNSIVQGRTGYQMIASYSPQTYDVWNASDQVLFDNNTGVAELTWNLSNIQSEDATAFGNFGIQIFNWTSTGVKQLGINIEEATVKLGNNEELTISELLGEQTLTLENGVAKYYPSMSKILETTGELKSGTLYIKAVITDYPTPDNIPSKEEYYETLHGNPVTTKAMIDRVKEAGFSVVRIPVTYEGHFDEATGTIDQEWLDRIKTIVDYAVSNDMYCIINMHHDTGTEGWLEATDTNYKENNDRFRLLWEQIAEKFKDYDEKLLFEGFNEMLDRDSNWVESSEEAYKNINKYNQLFVDTIRSTGGNNTTRCLLLTTYGATTNMKALQAFQLPTDSVKNKLIVEVHEYAPHAFTWTDTLLGGSEEATWGTSEEKQELATMFTHLNETFVSKNIPVIVGEFGAWDKGNVEERVKYTKAYIAEGKKYGIPCFWWDTGGKNLGAEELKNSAILNRNTVEWYFPEIMDALVNN